MDLLLFKELFIEKFYRESLAYLFCYNCCYFFAPSWFCIAQIFIYFSSAFPFFFSFFLPPPPSPSLTSVSLFLASSSSPFNPFSFLLPLLLQLLLLHLVFSFNFSPLFWSLSCNSSPTTKHGEGRVISKPLLQCMYGFRVLGFMHWQQIQWAEHLKSIHILHKKIAFVTQHCNARVYFVRFLTCVLCELYQMHHWHRCHPAWTGKPWMLQLPPGWPSPKGIQYTVIQSFTHSQILKH